MPSSLGASAGDSQPERDRLDARQPSAQQTTLQFHVNPSDEVPIYRQIVRQVRDAIAGGRLVPGDRLPSHRELSQQLVVAPLTIKRAYDELVQSGHIEMARGQGTFICEAVQSIQSDERLERIRPRAQRLVSEAALLGVDAEALVRLVREEARNFEQAQNGLREERGAREELRERDRVKKEGK